MIRVLSGRWKLVIRPSMQLNFTPRVQEDGGVAAASLDLAVLGSGSLQCAAAGGAHSDDPVACGLGLADAPGGLLADGVPLAVHLMVGALVLLHILFCRKLVKRENIVTENLIKNHNMF